MPDSSKAPAPLPSVHAYVDYRKFLSEWLEAKQDAIPGYTLSRFARAARCSASHVRNVLSRERDLLPPFVDTFCRALRLSREETEFFTLLVRYQQASTVLERAHLFQQVAGAQQLRSANPLEGAQLSCLMNITNAAVYELTFLSEFREDVPWIADVLGVSEDEADEALRALQATRLLVRQHDGTLQPAFAFNIATKSENWPALALFHERGMEKGQAVLSTITHEFCSLSVVGAIPKESVSTFREAVDEFHRRMYNLMAQMQTEAAKLAVEPADSVHMLQVQLVPLSRTIDSEHP